MRFLIGLAAFVGWAAAAQYDMHLGVILMLIYVAGAALAFFGLVGTAVYDTDEMAKSISESGANPNIATGFFYIMSRTIFWHVYLLGLFIDGFMEGVREGKEENTKESNEPKGVSKRPAGMYGPSGE